MPNLELGKDSGKSGVGSKRDVLFFSFGLLVKILKFWKSGRVWKQQQQKEGHCYGIHMEECPFTYNNRLKRN